MALDPKSVDRARRLRKGARIAVVVSEFHADLTQAMLASARSELEAAGLESANLIVASAPGAFELPLVARRLARRSDIDAVLCFALVLKGQTSHDHWVAHAACEGILRAGLETDKPILFGVLTCQSIEQARTRALSVAAGGREDKGREVARAAIDVLHSLSEIDAAGPRGRQS